LVHFRQFPVISLICFLKSVGLLLFFFSPVDRLLYSVLFWFSGGGVGRGWTKGCVLKYLICVLVSDHMKGVAFGQREFSKGLS